MNSFFVTGMPRSRTKWFSEYFTLTGAPCLHDPVAYCHKKDILDLIKVGVGISDSGLFFTGLMKTRTDIPVVFIERPVEEVRASLAALNLSIPDVADILAHKPEHALCVDFKDIDKRIQEIHEHCTDMPFNPELAAMMQQTIVKQDTFVVSDQYARQWT